MRLFIHILLIIFQTVLTQIGGLIYLITIIVVPKQSKSILKRFVLFVLLYGLCSFLVVPRVAEIFGRKQIEDNSHLKAHSFFYKIVNRTYVKTELNDVLVDLSKKIQVIDKDLKVIYLGANFPFFEGFPLLPHLSHDDGEKVDITLMYQDSQGKLTNKKKSISGYGVYEFPKDGEVNQNEICKTKNLLYDFPKYLSFGKINNELVFSAKGTNILIQQIINNPEINKIFIEPHLKHRLNINHAKVRFHGCQAVRHDDHIHIHIQL